MHRNFILYFSNITDSTVEFLTLDLPVLSKSIEDTKYQVYFMDDTIEEIQAEYAFAITELLGERLHKCRKIVRVMR